MAERVSDIELPRDDRLALIVLAVAQSLALLLLHKSVVHVVWPATDPRWLFALYALAIGLPLFMYMGAVRWRDRANAQAAATLVVVLGWTGWHAGWLESPTYKGDVGGGDFIAPLVFSLGLALFIAGFYFRSWREDGRLVYGRLLDNSWRNALTLGFLGGFLAVFWILLFLWAALFKVLDIDYFKDLFMRSEFAYPVSGLVGGWGLGLIRARVGLTATVRRLCEVLIRALLPLVAFILVIFLATLPVTGVAALWKTGFASFLLLTLAVVLLFGFNAMLAEDDAISMHRLLLPLVLGALVLVPANAGLAAWAMYLRVGQYGWSVDRQWGVFAIAFIAAYSVAYATIVLRHRGMSVPALRHLNTVLGAVLALALVVVNTPLVEFHRIAAKSQVTRLVDGRTTPKDFDARYLRWELGPYGVAQLDALKTSRFAEGKAALLHEIDRVLTEENRWAPKPPPTSDDLPLLRERYVALPGTTVEDDFLLGLGQDSVAIRFCLNEKLSCVVGDVDHAGHRYRLLVSESPYPEGVVWRSTEKGWALLGGVRRFDCLDPKSKPDRKAPFVLADAEFSVFSNGGCLYQILAQRANLAAYQQAPAAAAAKPR